MEIDRSMFLRHKTIPLLLLIQAILVVRLVSSETGESMQLYLSNQWYLLSAFSAIVLPKRTSWSWMFPQKERVSVSDVKMQTWSYFLCLDWNASFTYLSFSYSRFTFSIRPIMGLAHHIWTGDWKRGKKLLSKWSKCSGLVMWDSIFVVSSSRFNRCHSFCCDLGQETTASQYLIPSQEYA